MRLDEGIVIAGFCLVLVPISAFSHTLVLQSTDGSIKKSCSIDELRTSVISDAKDGVVFTVVTDDASCFAAGGGGDPVDPDPVDPDPVDPDPVDPDPVDPDPVDPDPVDPDPVDPDLGNIVIDNVPVNLSFSASNPLQASGSLVGLDGVVRKVYIVDPAVGSTSVPSCVNGLETLGDCEAKNLWARGAKRDEIWAVRFKTPKQVENRNVQTFIEFSTNPFGNFRLTSDDVASKYDYTVSVGVPGVMESTERGLCEFKNAGGGRVKLLHQEGLYSSLLYKDRTCVVPYDTEFYLNIRASSEYCDTPGALCNNALRPIGLAQ